MQVHKIEIFKENSLSVGNTCPVCRRKFVNEDVVVLCSGKGIVHNQCLQRLGRCCYCGAAIDNHYSIQKQQNLAIMYRNRKCLLCGAVYSGSDVRCPSCGAYKTEVVRPNNLLLIIMVIAVIILILGTFFFINFFPKASIYETALIVRNLDYQIFCIDSFSVGTSDSCYVLGIAL